ncbi:hypothetical protein IQ06DRAFT_293575 [Phaeosphaeriaceae sp. SRC1lsM3a]|nr:hypothetical protein IQ06DRAFT_293575 [Stagonospora sp. SRC1lsM3a]
MSTDHDDQSDTPSGDLYTLEQLESPEKYIEPGVPDQHPSLSKPSAGWVGGLTRLVRGIPACVWVANGHSSPITVVVHRFKPVSKMTGGGINAGADGGGLNAEGETWHYPATKKELQPGQTAPFPLWSRKNGYGSVSIFHGTGASKTSFIENDRIAAGYLAEFDGNPTLYLTDFKGNEVC